MKGRALILIFLFLILYLSCTHTQAETVTIDDTNYLEYQYTDSAASPMNTAYFTIFYVKNMVNYNSGIQMVQFDLSSAQFLSSKKATYDSYNEGVVLKTPSSDYICDGIIGYYKLANGNYRVYIWFDIDNWVNPGLTGIQLLLLEGHSSGNYGIYNYQTANNINLPDKGVALGKVLYTENPGIIMNTEVTIDYMESWKQQYTYYTQDGKNIIDVEREDIDGKFYTSMIDATVINTGESLLHETAYHSYNTSMFSTDLSNSSWYLNFTSTNGLFYNETVVFSFTPDGTLSFNQTHYTDPENIKVEWDITRFNNNDYNYLIQITATLDGDVSGNFWEASGNWNATPYISSASGVAIFDFYSEGYDLPVWIQGELWAQDKSTGTWIKLDNTPAVIYHEAALEPGKIWMDQTVYDTGDTATVNYETASDSAYVIVRKYPKAVWSQGEYYIWNVPAGSGTKTFVIPPSGTGDWKAELSESDITVNETMFSVNETTTPFLAWDDIDGIIGESQILHFYSNDVNATLQIYDADQTVIYDETVGDGNFRDYVISTQTNHAPGTWTAALNCSGSYHNDTLIMYAKDAYVSFNADSYTLDQTISIQYYLKRSTQTIVLYDANNKDVITWTTTGNYIHLGSGSVDFTLSDDNEYGLDIVAGVDANDIKLGLWRVEVLDRGQPIADNPVYDSAKVSRSIDDPADASNEMISIFFSPEGLFLIFTAALTMMGLVAAKHPAGGGAGAVVGVGFGVYFNVLPVWMLMLMVIALVVMAGISIASYYSGGKS